MAPKKKAEKKEESAEVEEKKDIEMKSETEKKEEPETKKEDEAATSAEPEAKKDDEEKKEDTKDEPMEDAKEEEGKAEEEEAAKEPEPPKELEEDAAADSRAKVPAGSIVWSSTDCTLSVLPMAGGRVFSSLTEGGLQFFLSSIRASFGLKAGRYMFETRIIEKQTPDKGRANGENRVPEPRQVFRVGLSLAGSSQFLGDSQDSICFDAEGQFVSGKKKQKVMKQDSFGKNTFAILVNLDESSPNAFTVSLFKNGERACKPQPIPENMKGKPLFPTITYRNITFEANFGPTAMKPLPFTCRMVQDAANADAEIVPASARKSGNHEVLFPVALPETGMFDWVDDFLAKNPGYTELSDRMILEWASKSGIYKPKNQHSNDKPTMKFGIPLMDDGSVRDVLKAVAPTMKRDFLIPELKGNLVKKDRQSNISNWKGRNFKMIASVLMGEPSKDYKDKIHALLLEEKTAKAEAERQKKISELQRNKKLEERKKKAEEAKKRKEKKEGDDAKEEDKNEEGNTEESKEETPATSPEDEVPPVSVELTDEELKTFVRKLDRPDLLDKTLTKFYASFGVPEADEGFDEVRYPWQDAAACAEIMKKYVLEQKLTQKAEDLQPSAWFKEQSTTWKKTLDEWKKRQSEWKDPAKRKALLQKKIDALKEKGEEDPKPPAEVDVESLDVFSVEDVADVGSGEPLFSKFTFEDWTLLSIRYELHLLMYAFTKDLDDPERKHFSESHLSFYFDKYYKKSFSISNFGFENFDDFVEIIKDVVQVDDKRFLQPQLAEDTPLSKFMQLTEEHRRDRVRRVDAGDETANLKFKRQAPARTEPHRESRDKGSGKSSGKSGSKGPRKGSGEKGGSRPAPSREKGGSSTRPWSQKGEASSRPPPRRPVAPAPPPAVRRPTYEASPRYDTNSGHKRSWGSSAPGPASQPDWKRQRTDSGYGGGGKGYGSGGKGYGKSGGGYRR